MAAICGYLVGLFGGMPLGEALTTHNTSIEAAMTGAFVFGPLMALIPAIVTVLFCQRRSHTS
ncbi:MAG: hypothetical protein Q8L77_02715 [Nitrospirota bacterium]|nr:hypothetical protein [Nitrospirota bacterium]